MFVSAERAVPASFSTASARLARLADSGWLHLVSEPVYDQGTEYLMRVGPLGPVPGASRLVRARFAAPSYREGTMTVALRWEAAGAGGGLFPALDADLRLHDAGDQGVRITLTGSYRPPLGAVGAGLDRLLLRSVATATISTLLSRVASALEGTPGPESAVPGPAAAVNGTSRPAGSR